MMDESKWKTIYNDVFVCFPPPTKIMKNLFVFINDKEMKFENTGDLLSYLCLEDLEDNKVTTIMYSLEDSDEYRHTIEDNVNYLLDEIKKRVV